MSIKDQLQADLKTAMLNKQELRRDVIRFTQAALKNAELAVVGDGQQYRRT